MLIDYGRSSAMKRSNCRGLFVAQAAGEANWRDSTARMHPRRQRRCAAPGGTGPPRRSRPYTASAALFIASPRAQWADRPHLRRRWPAHAFGGVRVRRREARDAARRQRRRHRRLHRNRIRSSVAPGRHRLRCNASCSLLHCDATAAVLRSNDPAACGAVHRSVKQLPRRCAAKAGACMCCPTDGATA